MHKYFWTIYGLLLCLAFASCQRVIDIDINPAASSLLVIEGNITNVTGTQTVYISNSVAYNSANVYPAVSNASVTIFTNSASYLLQETLPGQYTLNNFKGKVGQSYQLTVKVKDKTYNAVSVMPTPVALDSLGISALSVGSKEVKTVSVYYHDIGGMKNQYRFVMYVNGKQIKQIFTSNDNLTDGRLVNSTLYQDDVTIKTGDKIEVDMQCIDPNVYNYWYSLSQQGGNGPSNSATPSNPLTNFDNGALGYFSVHTTQRKSITAL